MIPTKEEAIKVWDTYGVPEAKRRHLLLVATVVEFLARKIIEKNISVNTHLLIAAAILHDIDKAVPKKPGETHPDTAVRILIEEGMPDVARLVATHPLHTILDPVSGPKTPEEKILYLADKMVKYEILTVDQRFDLWRAEDLPQEGRKQLEQAYPLVKKLETEILTETGLTLQDIGKLA